MRKFVSLFLMLILLLSTVSFAAAAATSSTTNIYFNGKRITSIDSNSTRLYYHQDYLDSPRIITDVNGFLVARLDYTPFGRELADSTKTKYKFTGKEEDTTKLAYFGARYYDSDTGRFTQIDPKYDAGESPYAYAVDNPMKFIDSDGKDARTPDVQKPQNRMRQFTPEEKDRRLLESRGKTRPRELEKMVKEMGYRVDRAKKNEGWIIRDVEGDIVRDAQGKPLSITSRPEIGTRRSMISTLLEWPERKGAVIRGVQKGIIIVGATLAAARVAEAAETGGASGAAKQTLIESVSFGGAVLGGSIGVEIGTPLGPWGAGICGLGLTCAGAIVGESALRSFFEENTPRDTINPDRTYYKNDIPFAMDVSDATQVPRR